MPKFVIVKDQPSFIIIKPDMPEAQKSETKKGQRPQNSQCFPKMAEVVVSPKRLREALLDGVSTARRLKGDGEAVELEVDEVALGVAGLAAGGDVGAASLLDGDGDCWE
jgi:hypothetical protein